VINVSWDDAQQFISWLNRKTGKRYRLPSEAEWEYAARAGTSTRFSTGDCITTAQANFDGNSPASGCPKGESRGQTAPVGSFSANPWGLFDMHGNVWEWTQDCWKDSYYGAPDDGSARADGDCGRRVNRGGSWSLNGGRMRSAARTNSTRGFRLYDLGFRLSRSR
jgi:formylglycine-generating enzyme required for sulfatase activity